MPNPQTSVAAAEPGELLTTITGTGSVITDAVDFAREVNATREPTQIGTGLSVFIPPGFTHEIVDTQGFQATPSRRVRTVTLTRTAALVDYLKRFSTDADCTLYVNAGLPGVVGVLDDADGWRDDRVTLQWQTTQAWARWQSASGKMLDQEAFADLIEEGLTEIAAPTGADLLELAQSIHATTAAKFSSDRRIVNGQVQLSYVEEINASAGRDGKMMIPAQITLVIAPFEGATPATITARLRYRIAGGKLALGIVLNQPTEFLLNAVDSEVQTIREAHPNVLTVWGQP